MADLLFYRGDLRGTLENISAQLAEDIAKTPDEYVLEAEEDAWADALAERYRVEAPALRRDAMWQGAARAGGCRRLARLHSGSHPRRAGPDLGLSKTGSMLARRLLVESAWHYSRPPRLGATLANRQAGQPDHVLAISNHAQQRLFRVNRRMRARGKPHDVTVVACARELSCFLWAAATAD